MAIWCYAYKRTCSVFLGAQWKNRLITSLRTSQGAVVSRVQRQQKTCWKAQHCQDSLLWCLACSAAQLSTALFGGEPECEQNGEGLKTIIYRSGGREDLCHRVETLISVFTAKNTNADHSINTFIHNLWDFTANQNNFRFTQWRGSDEPCSVGGRMLWLLFDFTRT